MQTSKFLIYQFHLCYGVMTKKKQRKKVGANELLWNYQLTVIGSHFFGVEETLYFRRYSSLWFYKGLYTS